MNDEFTPEEIGRRIRTQDNRITANPIFEVQEKRGKNWRYVQPFFTEVGADRYIAQNGHNHQGKLRVYASSAFRNWEWQALREYLLTLANDPEPRS